MVATMAPKAPLTAQQAEDRKIQKEQASAARREANDEVKALLNDLRYLALFPSTATPEEIRYAATGAIRQIQRKNSKVIGLEVLEGLDAC